MAEGGGGAIEAPPPLSPQTRDAKRARMTVSTELDGTSSSNLSHFYDKPLARFLVASHLNSDKNLSRVSPFLINKVVNFAAGGDVKNIKKLRNGTILIETLTDKQTVGIKKLTKFADDIPIVIKEHEKLNYSKGVIFCPDLVDFSVDEIKHELKELGVVEVYRVAKMINGIKKETPLHILTFGASMTPLNIKIGFYNLEVRPYVSSPMRCRKCHALGHTFNRCPEKKFLCPFCRSSEHSSCDREPFCINCEGGHPSNSNNCPEYIKEKEILSIASNSKIPYYEAKKRFNQVNAKMSSGRSYSQVAQIRNQCASCTELKHMVLSLTNQVSLLTNQLSTLLKVRSKEGIVNCGREENIVMESQSSTSNNDVFLSPLSSCNGDTLRPVSASFLLDGTSGHQSSSSNCTIVASLPPSCGNGSIGSPKYDKVDTQTAQSASEMETDGSVVGSNENLFKMVKDLRQTKKKTARGRRK